MPAIVASCGGPREGLIWGGSSSALLLLLPPPDALASLLRLKKRKAAAATATAGAPRLNARRLGNQGLTASRVLPGPIRLCAP